MMTELAHDRDDFALLLDQQLAVLEGMLDPAWLRSSEQPEVSSPVQSGRAPARRHEPTAPAAEAEAPAPTSERGLPYVRNEEAGTVGFARTLPAPAAIPLPPGPALFNRVATRLAQVQVQPELTAPGSEAPAMPVPANDNGQAPVTSTIRPPRPDAPPAAQGVGSRPLQLRARGRAEPMALEPPAHEVQLPLRRPLPSGAAPARSHTPAP
ncbi:MAG: hypothetical protein ABW321_25450, partial [Polyangiales bacterium]